MSLQLPKDREETLVSTEANSHQPSHHLALFSLLAAPPCNTL